MFELSMGDVRSVEEIRSRFYAIAIELMSKYDIELRRPYPAQRLQVSSLELYLYKKGVWEDPTTHAKKIGINDQLMSGRWYVHRYKKDGKFRPPRRRGIDITVGSELHEVHAGLLVRGVNEIDGPALALNSFLFGHVPKSVRRNWDYNGQDEFFRSIDGQSVFSGSIALVEKPNPRSGKFYVGPRIGLSNSKADEKYLNSAFLISTRPGSGLQLLVK